MKKIIITIALVLIYGLSISQNNNSNLKVESEKIFNKVTKNNIWVLDTTFGFSGFDTDKWEFDQTEIVTSRNDMGQPIEIILTEKANASNWTNVYQAIFSYFDNDSVFEYKVKEWNTQTNNWNSQLSYYSKYDEEGVLYENFMLYWDNTEQYFYQGNKELYTYDTNGLLITKEDRDWNESNSVWEDWGMTHHYYDENNNDTLIIQDISNGSGGWRNYSRIRKTYNALNQLVLSQEWIYDNYWAEWVAYSKTTYTYFDNGLLETEFTERYDTDNEEWYNLTRTDYYYYSNNKLERKEEYDLETINNSLKYEYTYNTNLDETSFFLYSYNAKNWTLFYKVFDIYDENNNQTSYYSQMLDGTWQNFLKEEYHWNTFQTSSSLTIDNSIVIFPNPVSKTLNIQTSDNIFVQIFNSSGTLQLSSDKQQIDVSSLKKGLYLVLIKNENYTITKKIIIQ